MKFFLFFTLPALVGGALLSTLSAAGSTPSTVVKPGEAKAARPVSGDEAWRAGLTKMYLDYGIHSLPIHRGGGKHQPENTLESFEYAWSRKLVPEGDIRTTKDDVIIWIHDNTVNRTAPGAPAALEDRSVSELTLAELKTVDVGEFRGKPGQRIPTLDEVFGAMAKDPSRFIYMDYKAIDLKRLAAAVRKHGVDRQVIFTTDRHDLIRQWRQLIPEAQTMIWMGGSQEEIQKKLTVLRQAQFADTYIVHLHYKPTGKSGAYQLSDQCMLTVRDELKAKGIILQIMPWDIEDPAIYKRLFKLGLDSIGTDYPDMILPLLRRYFGPNSAGQNPR